MNVGRMRNLVKILARVDGTNRLNETVTADRLFAEVWAEFRNTGGSEVSFADGTVHVADVRLCMRFLQGVEEKMVVLLDNRRYEVVDVDDVEGKHVELRLTCKELR